MKSICSYILFVLLLTCASQAFAQEGKDRHPGTNHTEHGVNGEPPKEKTIRYIYKDSPRKVQLYGNPCAIQITKEMGFVYEIEHKPDRRFQTRWYRFTNNLGVSTRLIFTHGPWWKATINKRLKRCAQYSGDRRG